MQIQNNLAKDKFMEIWDNNKKNSPMYLYVIRLFNIYYSFERKSVKSLYISKVR